jgi:23S rRNA (adenine2503-C2)-methyltransferase
MSSKEVITDVSMDKLPELVESMGLKSYVADQLVGWLYKEGVESFEQMTNVSRKVKERLAERFDLSALELVDELSANDGTKKFVFRLRDDHKIETVFIPVFDGRGTLCISSQVGCALECGFCRTGEMGLIRNLTLGEVIGQVIEAKRRIEQPITNVVFMGMGEPLMNLEVVCSALEILLSEKAFCLSKKRVTVSTSGLIPELKELTRRYDMKIAISLSATTDEVRSRMMPINERYPIDEIMKFCREYSGVAKHRVTFEYVLIGGENDTIDDMRRLVRLLTGIRAKINLIPFNPFPEAEWKAPEEATVERWRDFLVSKGIQVNVRVSRGKEILAACGQLASPVA